MKGMLKVAVVLGAAFWVGTKWLCRSTKDRPRIRYVRWEPVEIAQDNPEMSWPKVGWRCNENGCFYVVIVTLMDNDVVMIITGSRDVLTGSRDIFSIMAYSFEKGAEEIRKRIADNLPPNLEEIFGFAKKREDEAKQGYFTGIRKEILEKWRNSCK